MQFIKLSHFCSAVSLLLLPLAFANCGRKEQPNGEETIKTEIATVDLAIPTTSTTRATFVGKYGMPDKIQWLKKDAVMEQPIANAFYVTNAGGLDTKASWTPTDATRGKLSFPYKVNMLNSNGDLSYIACDQASTAPLDGQVTSNGSGSLSLVWDQSSGFYYYSVEKSRNQVMDVKSPAVSWPLLSYNVNDRTKLLSVYNKTKGGSVAFDLFGNMLLVNIRNFSNVADFDFGASFENSYLPSLTIECNGMAFRNSRFKLRQGNGEREITLDKPSTESHNNGLVFTTKLKSMKFNGFGDNLMIPVWFRPYNPSILAGFSDTNLQQEGRKQFYLTVKLSFNVKTTNNEGVASYSLKTFTRTLNAQALQKLSPVTGTLFGAYDGHYYLLNIDFGEGGIQFGANSFFDVTTNIPAFD